jgi:hypothetical protein
VYVVGVVGRLGELWSRRQTEAALAEGRSLSLTCRTAATIDSSGRDTERQAAKSAFERQGWIWVVDMRAYHPFQVYHCEKHYCGQKQAGKGSTLALRAGVENHVFTNLTLRPQRAAQNPKPLSKAWWYSQPLPPQPSSPPKEVLTRLSRARQYPQHPVQLVPALPKEHQRREGRKRVIRRRRWRRQQRTGSDSMVLVFTSYDERRGYEHRGYEHTD